ncbi:hypothetical protein SLS62_007952 [Diatrype stigma]|uniref:SRR1-like domain-containing protein n=1 Tax=Diatrype stigma TaxID=117547 RepID=A0AAN9UKP4_9PEZI
MENPKKDPVKLLLPGPGPGWIDYTLREYDYNHDNKKEVRIQRKFKRWDKEDPLVGKKGFKKGQLTGASEPFCAVIAFNRYQELRDLTIPAITPNGDGRLKSPDVACPLVVNLPNYKPLAEAYVEAPDTLWEEHKKNWEASALCKTIEQKIRDSAISPAASKIVCFGLGIFATLAEELREPIPRANLTSEPVWKYRTRRMVTQHAAALTMQKVLQETRGKVELIAQEPDYDADTMRILEKEGFEVIKGHGARGFTRVDENTLVFTVDNDAPVKQVVADIASPAAMIWTPPKPLRADEDDWELTGNNYEP